ncbi:hypothetical protein LSAT2_019996 [Lamellibrachia satsuma]|nr:hypothetical protein LSAT2_019996 [Lamellibrachia satsuma]
MNSPGQRMSYPYSAVGKFIHFPWKHYWKGRGFRYVVYGSVISYILFYKLHCAVNSPGNVKMWQKIRADRLHNPFAPPHE